MFWFKNLMPYLLTKTIDLSEENLKASLEDRRFISLDDTRISSFGWAAPLSTSEELYYQANGYILLVAQEEKKILPPFVINRELKKRVDALEEAQQRKLRKVEKLSIKDDVVAILLKQAFSRITQTALIIDIKSQQIWVDSSNSKRAENVLALLRASLGSLPVVPLVFANDPSLVMTDWLNETPDWLTVLEEVELMGLKEDGIAKFKQQDLDSNEIYSLLEAGKVVTKIALEWEDNLSFVLCDNGTLKCLKFADNIKETNEDISKEDIAQRFDADFVLMTGELSELMENLIDEFGGIKED